MARPASASVTLDARSTAGWALPSMAVGAVATLVDIGVLLAAMRWLGVSKPVGAMIGVAVGSTVAFWGNRRFAFRSAARDWRPEALRFVAGTAVGMVAHALVVKVLTERGGVPVVLAKLTADVCVFTFGQLLLLRFFVFPARAALERRQARRWDPAAGDATFASSEAQAG